MYVHVFTSFYAGCVLIKMYLYVIIIFIFNIIIEIYFS